MPSEPPLRVYACVTIGGEPDEPCWWIYDSEEAEFVHAFDSSFHMRPSVMTVIDDPKNDPEAVEIIERAKRKD